MSTLGNVTCLSGTVTYISLEALLVVFDKYLDENPGKNANLNELWKHGFGEDRYLTQYFAKTFGRWSTSIHTGFVSETEAAVPLSRLVRQRRRWFLASVATEAAALCEVEFWRSTPFLSTYRLCIQPVSNGDLQMLLLALTISQLRLEGFAWILPITASCFLMDILILLSVGAVQTRMCVLAYPLAVLLFPLISSAGKIWALMSLMDRRW